MKFIENKNIFNKIIIAIIVVLVCGFCFSSKVQAKEDGLEGKLVAPVANLFVVIGDGAMSILQSAIFHIDTSLININTSSSFWAKFIVVVAAIVIAAVSIIAVVASGGALLSIVVGVIKVVLVTGAVTTITFPITTGLVEGRLPESFYLPLYSITPQEIFANKIPLLDVDYFNTMDSIKLSDGSTMESTAAVLKTTVSNWYTILRDIALVASLSILVYIGIRIMISTTASDKSKYKQMLMDWIVAICLLFTMHYIMSFSNLAVNKVIKVIDTTGINPDSTTNTEIQQPEFYTISDKKVVKKAYETLVEKADGKSPYDGYFTNGKDGEMYWPAENFMQQARINAQLLDDENETYIALGWKLIYVALVVFTFIFLFTYLKRVLYMTFLTIIAPLVALTYPIDKMNDGKAQAFNTWFKEYIFNLLIQPMHLILYMILVGSAMDFASKNIIYVLVALFFMVPAEKLLRTFFGFEKAKTPGLFAGPGGAALMMSGFKGLLGKRPPSSSKSSSSSSSSSSSNADGKSRLRFNEKFDKAGAMLGQEQPGRINDTANNIQNNDNELDQQKQTELKKKQEEEKKKQEVARKRQELQQQLEQERLRMENERLQQEMERQAREQSAQQYKDEQQQVGQGIKNAKVKLSNTVAGRTTRKIRGAVGSPIRMARQHNRIVDAGARAVSAGLGTAKYTMHKGLENYGNKIKEFHPVKTGAKVALKAGLATEAAIAGGLIAGFSGSPQTTFQGAVAGAMGGYKLGGALGDRVVDSVGISENTKEFFKDSYYGEQRDEQRMKEYTSDFTKNYDNQIALERKIGNKQEARKFMKEAAGTYVSNGITDIDDLAAGYLMEKEGIKQKDGTIRSINRDMAIAGVKYGKRLGGKPGDMKEKDRKEWHTTIANELGSHKAFNSSNMDKDKKTDEVFDVVNSYYDYKKRYN